MQPRTRYQNRVNEELNEEIIYEDKFEDMESSENHLEEESKLVEDETMIEETFENINFHQIADL